MRHLIKIEHLEDGPGNARLLKVGVGKKQLVTPTYFPAVSKKEIRDPDDKFVELVTASGYPRLLVSAYDYGRTRTSNQRRIIGKLSDYYRRGAITMLDSGVFESFWREDPRWGFSNYRRSVKNVDSDLFLSFDVLRVGSASADEFRKQTIKCIGDSIELTDGSHCIPIIHGKNPSELLAFATGLMRKIPQKVSNLAVSERELGQSISERCTTVAKIRKVLNNGSGGLLHILGCGHPLSMACYVYCGADMFDSLDWAVSAFDPFEDTLTETSHLELLDCKCEVCSNSKIDSSSRVYLHNLLSYQEFTMKLHSMIRQKTLADYIQEEAGKAFHGKLAKLFS